MSHQNTDDQNTTETEISQKTDHELAVTLRANALATQDPSPIFTLNVDCWEEVFDWLSITDVHTFGQTCKFFHRIAGKYYEWKYKRNVGDTYRNSVRVHCGHLDGFAEFTTRLSFYDSEPDESFLYVLANCNPLIEMDIANVRSTALDINCLEKMLARVENLKFSHLEVPDEFMESFLKLCTNSLKRLTIDKSTEYGWMHYKYPQLQHLETYECNSSEELISFFGRNPNVRSFSTEAANILQHRKEIMASTIELDDLTVQTTIDIDAISTALIDLHKRGFYKRLHFVTKTEKHLVNLPGLTTLHISTCDYIRMPVLPSVTVLVFQAAFHGIRNEMDMEEVSNALVNLECVFNPRFQTNSEYLMPFIRNSKKLKEIKMDYFRNNDGDIDPVSMNIEREKLNGAHKVTIYVDENDYLIVKWKYNKTDFGLIEIKRNKSYDGVWDTTFGWW